MEVDGVNSDFDGATEGTVILCLLPPRAPREVAVTLP
jgi:hypothetical protein